ncbi:MAG: hypothetical protein V1755_01870 [Chloroflexota bacterium]
MKVIDRTPFQDEKGNFGLLQRFQGMLEYGFAWQAEIEAQKPVVAQLDRVLEKGFTLIRNLNLQNSRILEPLILVGPPGVFVLYVTPVSGFFEAKGDEWNITKNNRRMPAKANPMTRVTRLARAVQVYLNRQGVYLPGMVEPVLIAASPGVHIDLLRPIVRVVLSDAIKQFGASLLQARPVLRSQVIHEVVDHLINPQEKSGPLQPQPEQVPAAVVQEAGEAPARARAIFHAAEEAKPFDPADLNFEFDERGAAEGPAGLFEPDSSQRPVPAAPRRGFSSRQWVVLVFMLLVESAVLAGFVYLLLFGSR